MEDQVPLGQRPKVEAFGQKHRTELVTLLPKSITFGDGTLASPFSDMNPNPIKNVEPTSLSEAAKLHLQPLQLLDLLVAA
jgi:hypothetical protein